MARNTPLGTVRSMVKSETGKSLDTTATAQDAEINQIIYDVQQWLSSEYDWPFLRSRWDVTVPAGTRYKAFPTVDGGLVPMTVAINFERAGDLKVFVKWNQVWQPVDYGIGETSEFNYLDSDRGVVLDPVQRWQFDDEGNFEVWPIPASNALLRFVGQRALTELRSSVTVPIIWDDTKTLDLDDLLVTYFAAAEYLTREQQTDNAKTLLTMAQNRMQLVRATYPSRERPATVVGGSTVFNRRAIRTVPMVVVGGR